MGNVLRTDSIASQFQLIEAKQWIHRLSIPEAGGDAVICILAVTLQATSAWWIMRGNGIYCGIVKCLFRGSINEIMPISGGYFVVVAGRYAMENLRQ